MIKQQTSKGAYGTELILDLHNCDTLYFKRHNIIWFLNELCSLIKMEREDLHFWDYEGDKEGYKNAPDHLKGISAIQFIKTSNITIHTLDVLGKIFINVFSCKEFDRKVVEQYSETFFAGKIVNSQLIERL